MIDSVKIVHKYSAVGEKRFLSDFFRSIGSYVVEDVMEDSKYTTQFDVIIIITKDMNEKELENLKKNYPDFLIWKGETTTDEGKKFALQTLIKSILLKDFSDNIVSRDKEIKDLQKIINYFIDHKLMKVRNSYAYFYTNRELVESAKREFLDVYENILNDSKENENESRYLFYFRMDIIRCINETCFYLNEGMFFNTEAVLAFMKKHMTRFAYFSNFYVLMGMISELDVPFQREAKLFFEKALENVKEKTYGYFCCYKLGRYYEKVEKNWNQAIKYYKEAQRLNKCFYRAPYKIGLYYESINKSEYAMDAYTSVVQSLKEREHYLQKKEYECLYKVYYHMAEIFRLSGQYSEAANKYERILTLSKSLEKDKNLLYKEIYGSEEEKYRIYTKKRMRLNLIYERLIYIYKKTGEEDKISEAMSAIENL